MKDETKALLYKAYLIIYDNFAADTKEIAEELGTTVDKTFKLLNSCDLVVGELIVEGCSGGDVTRKNFPGVPYTWQCWQTYDSIDREEAIQVFHDKYGPLESSGCPDCDKGVPHYACMRG